MFLIRSEGDSLNIDKQHEIQNSKCSQQEDSCWHPVQAYLGGSGGQQPVAGSWFLRLHVYPWSSTTNHGPEVAYVQTPSAVDRITSRDECRPSRSLTNSFEV
mmetsp:Transcript_21400/g.31150  ORF Transcript_21400/g.31150 Transcript_21400/m.31150 type:complete len:102 (-) Transcript_21400:618-923(-)